MDIKGVGGTHKQKAIPASVIYIFIKKKILLNELIELLISEDGNPTRIP